MRLKSQGNPTPHNFCPNSHRLFPSKLLLHSLPHIEPTHHHAFSSTKIFIGATTSSVVIIGTSDASAIPWVFSVCGSLSRFQGKTVIKSTSGFIASKGPGCNHNPLDCGPAMKVINAAFGTAGVSSFTITRAATSIPQFPLRSRFASAVVPMLYKSPPKIVSATRSVGVVLCKSSSPIGQPGSVGIVCIFAL